MNNELFSKQITEQIAEHKISPRPKWYYQLRTVLFALAVITAVILGAFVVATIIFLLVDHDWSIYSLLGTGRGIHILKSIPYFWITILALLIILVRYCQRNLKRGYRIHTWMVILGGAIATSLLGGIFFSRGFHSELHEYFQRHIPLYDQLIYSKEDMWNDPAHGLISGVIVFITPNRIDISNNDHQIPWGVVYDSQTIIDSDLLPFAAGARVRVVGTRLPTDSQSFAAQSIEDWDILDR